MLSVREFQETRSIQENFPAQETLSQCNRHRINCEVLLLKKRSRHHGSEILASRCLPLVRLDESTMRCFTRLDKIKKGNFISFSTGFYREKCAVS